MQIGLVRPNIAINTKDVALTKDEYPINFHAFGISNFTGSTIYTIPSGKELIIFGSYLSVVGPGPTTPLDTTYCWGRVSLLNPVPYEWINLSLVFNNDYEDVEHEDRYFTNPIIGYAGYRLEVVTAGINLWAHGGVIGHLLDV